MLQRVKKSEKGAIQAFRTHKNEFYKLGDTCRPGDMLEEPPSIPDINNGEFDTLHEKGDILGVFVGHDHKNSFVGRYKDMDLGFTQSAGFNVYGNRTKRGVRCFVLHEDDPTHYDTYTRTYEELVGTKVHRPVFDYLSSKAPATMDAAIPMIVKTVVGLAVIVALIILLAVELVVHMVLLATVFKPFLDQPITSDALNMIGIESKGYLYTYLISTTVGYGIAFILNRKITFKADVNPTLSMILYAIMVVFTIFANGWIGSAMTTFAQGHNLTGGFWDMVIKLIGMAIPTLWTYPCNRFTARRNPRPLQQRKKKHNL